MCVWVEWEIPKPKGADPNLGSESAITPRQAGTPTAAMDERNEDREEKIREARRPDAGEDEGPVHASGGRDPHEPGAPSPRKRGKAPMRLEDIIGSMLV